MTACSSGSAGSLTGSGGGPLGWPTGDDSTGSGDDASSAPSPDAGVLGTTPDGGASGDGAQSPTGDGGDGAAPVGDASGDGAVGSDFTLIDTTVTTIVDGSPVTGYDPIVQGATINLAVTGSALSIRANTTPAVVGSVAFALDATYTHTEETAPYTLCSDNGAGVITSCASILTVGKHTLTAIAYSLPDLGGTPGTPMTLDFTIVDVDAGTDGGTDATAD
jgi:hypothetical protein